MKSIVSWFKDLPTWGQILLVLGFLVLAYFIPILLLISSILLAVSIPVIFIVVLGSQEVRDKLSRFEPVDWLPGLKDKNQALIFAIAACIYLTLVVVAFGAAGGIGSRLLYSGGREVKVSPEEVTRHGKAAKPKRKPKLVKLEIDSPEDESEVTSPTIEIVGRTEPGAKITINGTEVPLDATGSFRFTVNLDESRNSILVEAARRGKKTTRVELTIYRRHFIDFSLRLNGRTIIINGTTNVPEDSTLNISVSRLVDYFNTVTNEKMADRVVDLADGQVSVKDGKFAFSAYLSDGKWYQEGLQENRAIGWEFDRIRDDCYVLIAFTPKFKQPQSVYDELGKNFENLRIEEPPKAGFKSIQVKKSFKLGFDPNT